MKLRILRHFFALCVLVGALFALSGFAGADLTVHFMDIGRNDGIVVECDGEYAFFDSGEYQYGARAVDYMNSLGITHLKYYIGTHAHTDHVGGASYIMEKMSPEACLMPHDGVRTTIRACARTKESRDAADACTYITVHPGEVYTIGGATLKIIGPLQLVRFTSPKVIRENLNSMIAVLTYGERSFLLTGDTDPYIIRTIEKQNPGIARADVYKNAHHYSNLPIEILNIVKPQYVVFSTDNGHLPAAALLRRAANAGALPVVTAGKWNSTVVFHTDGQSLELRSTNAPTYVQFKAKEVSVYEGRKTTVKALTNSSIFNKMILYRSMDESIATVDEGGHITGVGVGTTTILALSVNGVQDECKVTVMPASVKLSRTELTVKHHATSTLRASILPAGTRGVTISWKSDNPAIATVTDKGKITGISVGTTTIRATLSNGQSAACTVTVNPIKVTSVSVTPGTVTLTIGGERQMTGRVYPKNATYPGITWKSADPSIATVDQNGLLRAVGVGKTEIIVTSEEGKERRVKVTVKPVYVTRVTVTAPASGTVLYAGVKGKDTLQLSASVLPDAATIKDLTWRSSNTRVAVVDANGKVTAVGVGSATIYAVATDGSNRRGYIRITAKENIMNRPRALFTLGEVVYSAKQIRYQRDQLVITLYCANRSKAPVTMPPAGTLVFIDPEGNRIRLAAINPGRTVVRPNGTSTFTVRLPRGQFPKLEGLDFSLCDATVSFDPTEG